MKNYSPTGSILLGGILLLYTGIEKAYGYAYASITCGALLLVYGFIRERREKQLESKDGEVKGNEQL